MQISIEKTEGLERNLNVSIPAENINSKISEKLNELGKQVKIKGFRPGKVPKAILSKRFGKHARQEVISDLISSSIQQAITENKLDIAERPEILEFKDLGDGGYSFTAKLELMPEIPAIDYATLEINTKSAEVTDDDVNNMIVKLQKQKQVWKDSKGKIAKGDLVTIEYVAKDGDTVIHPESGKEKMIILLGESGVPDELLEALLDKKVQDSVALNLHFPEHFNIAKLANQKVDFSFEITSHKKGKLPAIDKDFVESFGIDSGKKEDLLVEIKDNLNRELDNTIDTKNKVIILNAIRDQLQDVQISESMLVRECANLSLQARERQKHQGIENPASIDMLIFEKQAKERIINSLIINKVVKDQNISVDFVKVREKIFESAQTFEDPEQIVEYYYKTPELMASIESVVLESQVVEWIKSQVKLNETTVSFDELMGNTI